MIKKGFKKWCSILLSISIIFSIFIPNKTYANEMFIDNFSELKINEITNDEIYFGSVTIDG